MTTTPRSARSLALRSWLFSTLLLVIVPSRAHAQASEETQIDLATEADVRFELGVDAQRRGDCRGALQHYLASQRLVPNKNVVFNIARCFEELERYPEAFRYYADYLESDLDDSERRVAEAAVQRIRPRVALVRVETDPPGALVYLDRRDLGSRGRTPRTLAVEPGAHRVLVQAEGHEPAQSDEVRATVGGEVVVSVPLVRILGSARVVGAPQGAAIRVDDEESPSLGVVPATIELTPGAHTLIVSAPGRQTTRVPVSVAARETTPVSIDLPLETGSLVVDAQERGALIEIDGEAAGFTPAVLSEVPSGRHTVRVVRPGFRPYEDEIDIQPREQTRIDARLRLLQEVTAASREAESIEDAPASVSLIPQEELRAFGYQTLWDAVAGQRGVYQTNDLTYASLGIRGFSQPSDYGNRVLVLTSGHSMNDDLLGSSYVGYDARADLIDVERIELVRGAGSALYGTNAFFGVINVVTRDRDSLLGPHVSIATDAQRMVRARVGGGTRFSRDAGFWATAAGIYSQGHDYSFPEYAPDGDVQGADEFHTAHAAARGWIGDLTLELSFNRRDKRIPTGAFDTILGDPRSRGVDTRGFLELRWEPRFGRELSLFVRAFSDLYLFEGDYAYEGEAPGDPSYVSEDRWRGVWVGGEARATWSPLEWLRLTAGAETRGSALAELEGRVRGQDPFLNPSGSEGFWVAGGYAVAQIEPIREITIDVGGRFDYVSTFADGAVSPRAALIFRPWEGGTIKLLGGGAFRAPSVYELRYNDGGETQISPASLVAERIWSGELEISQRIDEVTLIANAFYNRIDHFVTLDQVVDPGTGDLVLQYANSADIAQTIGAEAEVRRDFRQGWMVAATYSFQRTRIGDLLSDADEARLTNSPEHLVGLRGVAPLVPELLSLAARLRVEGPRLGRRIETDGTTTLVEGDVPVIADLILSGEIAPIHLTWAAGVRNLFDWRYGYPGGDDVRQVFVPQSGRELFVQTTITF
ncbi:TonB-dependent receptor domain-containing protein [Sandaracinus amylolyticus]|uniref:TonB-dependent receptor domain-containing protein n=1 Tax=Sandaracinus amylolyticus TaxID=927083 RepID=UPI001F269B37|nr:TonB-dependent receptor [Sandaracinus amylolyticus]UJR87057.1 Hypothetical protein I5071_91580 [Sandaracinus amylolyticus]